VSSVTSGCCQCHCSGVGALACVTMSLSPIARVFFCRTCPLDSKEAVSSVIWAAPRSADLPELMEVSTRVTVPLCHGDIVLASVNAGTVWEKH